MEMGGGRINKQANKKEIKNRKKEKGKKPSMDETGTFSHHEM